MVSERTKRMLEEGFLGKSQSSNEITDEEPVKVTILLPKDTLEMMDELVENARVGSRGRLIQLLIDDVWAMQDDFEVVEQGLEKMADPKSDKTNTILSLGFGCSGITRRLSRYYKESRISYHNRSTKGSKS